MNRKIYDVSQKILSKNDIKANELRKKYKDIDLYVINMMSSPGSGKTTLLENFAINEYFKFAVIEGDLETNRDADRLIKRGINAYQITTGDACHLEASMIESAYDTLYSNGKLDDVDFLFIENVGNLVCPASYDLGSNINIVLLSTPEGDDKILKYPTMFMTADIILITKSDIMEYFDFSIENIKSHINKVNPKSKLFIINTKDENTIKELANYLIWCKDNKITSNHNY